MFRFAKPKARRATGSSITSAKQRAALERAAYRLGVAYDSRMPPGPQPIQPLIPGLRTTNLPSAFTTYRRKYRKPKKAYRPYCGAIKGDGQPYVRKGEMVAEYKTSTGLQWREVVKSSKRYSPTESIQFADSAVRKRIRELLKKYKDLNVQLWARNPQSGQTENLDISSYI